MKRRTATAPRFANPAIPTISKRVLVLDDDADLLSLYAITLARAGCTIDTAADGEQGWAALCATEYDLLLTDNDMPHLTGLELVSRLRRAGMTLPVILASGSTFRHSDADSEWLGFAAVLHKPFTSGELVAAVQLVIPLQRMAPALMHHLAPSASEFMPANQRRFTGLNE